MATLTVVTQGQTGGAATTATTAAVNVPAVADRELILLVLGSGAPTAPAGWTLINGNAFRAPSHSGTISLDVPASTGPIGWVVYQVDGVVPGPTPTSGTNTSGSITIGNPDSDVLLPVVVGSGTYTPPPEDTILGFSWWDITTTDFATTDSLAGVGVFAVFGLTWVAAAVAYKPPVTRYPTSNIRTAGARTAFR